MAAAQDTVPCEATVLCATRERRPSDTLVWEQSLLACDGQMFTGGVTVVCFSTRCCFPIHPKKHLLFWVGITPTYLVGSGGAADPSTLSLWG